MPNVLVTSRSFGSGAVDVERRLAAAGLGVLRGPASHDLAGTLCDPADCVAWIAGTGPVTEAHLDALPGLRVIARYGVGVDSVDVAAARARGIVVTNTPGANSDAVADHTLALLLAALRGVVRGDRRVRAGDWRADRAREVSSLRIGLIGLGRIGCRVLDRLRGFGPTVFAVDPFLGNDEIHALGAQPGAEVIPKDVDVVLLHAPGPGRIVDREWLARARPGLVLVNTARGSLVDEDAVAEALRSGQLDAYAADALAQEGAASRSALLDPDLADRVVLTPHSAAQTVESVDRMGSMAVDAVLDVLAGRTPAHVVDERT